MISCNKRHWTWFLLGVIAAWGMILRVGAFAGRNYWRDEKIIFDFIRDNPFLPFWQRLYYGQELNAFPGQYLMTFPFVHFFHGNKWGASIPYFLVTLAGYCILYILCERHLRSLAAKIIVFLIYSLNNGLIFHALEFRAYSVLATQGLLVFWLTSLVASYQGKHRFGILLGSGIGLWITALFHPYGMLIIGCSGIFWALITLYSEGWRTTLGRFVPFYACFLTVCLPFWFWYASAIPFHSLARDVFQYIPNPVSDPIGFIKGVVGNLFGNKRLYFTGFGVLFLPWIKHKDRIELFLFFITLIVLPIMLILISDTLSGYWFIQRQFIWVMPLFAIFIGRIWDPILDLWESKLFKNRGQRPN